MHYKKGDILVVTDWGPYQSYNITPGNKATVVKDHDGTGNIQVKWHKGQLGKHGTPLTQNNGGYEPQLFSLHKRAKVTPGSNITKDQLVVMMVQMFQAGINKTTYNLATDPLAIANEKIQKLKEGEYDNVFNAKQYLYEAGLLGNERKTIY